MNEAVIRQGARPRRENPRPWKSQQPSRRVVYKRVRKRRRRGAVLPIIGLLVSLAIFAYPVVMDAYRQWEYSQTISDASSYDFEDPRYQEILRQAELYNLALACRLPADADPSGIWEYSRQLDYNVAGVMGWVEIPVLSTRLPIYHGTSDESLMAGVGHIEGTSLPIGGEATKCVLSGHTGMKNDRMFDSIGELREGDAIILHTMGREIYYETTYQEVVEPSAVENLRVDTEGSELVLLTCTPRGINSHRLLVHANQTDSVDRGADAARSVANYLLSPTVLAFTAFALLLLLLLVARLVAGRRKKKEAERR